MSASYRKTHLHLSRAVPEIMAADLREPFRLHFGALLGLLGWSGVDLEQRVGVACAIHVCGLLGWAKPSLDQTQL